MWIIPANLAPAACLPKAFPARSSGEPSHPCSRSNREPCALSQTYREMLVNQPDQYGEPRDLEPCLCCSYSSHFLCSLSLQRFWFVNNNAEIVTNGVDLADKWLIDKGVCLLSNKPLTIASKCLVFSHSPFHSRPSGSVEGRDRRQSDTTRMKKSRTELLSP